jgi:hypothetical protein
LCGVKEKGNSNSFLGEHRFNFDNCCKRKILLFYLTSFMVNTSLKLSYIK